MNSKILAPSILAGDHAALGNTVAQLQADGIEWAHVDIMDGHFVPNLTFGPQTVKCLRKHAPNLFYDTHLMLSEPWKYVEAFAEAGSDLISIHIEPDYDPAPVLEKIRDLGKQNGIVFNPRTPAKLIEPYIDQVDLVLAMTVQPGFGGQSFQPQVLEKVKQIDTWRKERGLNFRIEVDGGVNAINATDCAAAGVDTFVAGSAYFKAEDKQAFRAAVTQ